MAVTMFVCRENMQLNHVWANLSGAVGGFFPPSYFFFLPETKVKAQNKAYQTSCQHRGNSRQRKRRVHSRGTTCIHRPDSIVSNTESRFIQLIFAIVCYDRKQRRAKSRIHGALNNEEPVRHQVTAYFGVMLQMDI